MRSVFIIEFLYSKHLDFQKARRTKAIKFNWLSFMFLILIFINEIKANKTHQFTEEKWWQSDEDLLFSKNKPNYLDQDYIKTNLVNQTEKNEKYLTHTLNQLNNEIELISEEKNQTKSTASAMSFFLNESEVLNVSTNQVPESKNGVDLYDIPTSITVLLSFLYIMVSLVAVFGNLMVFYIVLISKRMRNVTNLFIANLALADILIGSLAIPFQFTAALLQRWVLPTFLCPLCPTVQTVSLNVSIFTLTAISVDRHRAITKPLANKLTKSKANIIIIFIWLFSLILALPTFLNYKFRYITVSKVINLDNQIDYNHQNDQSINSNAFQKSQTFPQSSSLNSKNSNSFGDLNASSKADSLHVKNLETFETFETIPFCDVDSSLISDQLRRYYNHVLVFVQFFLPLFIICYCYIHMAIKLNSKDLSTNARNDCKRALQIKRRVS